MNPLVNTATVAVGAGQTDPTPGNNSATDTDTPAAVTDLAITKTDGSATYTAGTGISYTIVVSNLGPSNAVGASVADVVPASITGVSVNCVASGTAVCGTNASAGNNVSFTGVNIAAYESGGMELADLVPAILGETGRVRVRLSSLEPERIRGKLLEVLAHDRVCPHFHLPGTAYRVIGATP